MDKEIRRQRLTDIYIKNRILLTTFLINLIVFVLLILLFCPRFESELDITMQTLLYGGNGTYSSHLLFSNIIIGKILSTCMKIIPFIPWYIVFHYLMTFVSLMGITFITLKRNDSKTGYIIAVCMLFFIGYECYICPNYMKTAVLLAATGIYISYYCIEENTKYLTIIAAFFLLVSSFICFKIFLFTVCLGSAGIAVVYAKENSVWQWVKKKSVIFIGVFVIAVAANVFDVWFYSSNIQWENIGRSREYYQKILGFGVPDYTDEIQKKISIDQRDYSLLTSDILVSSRVDVDSFVVDISSEIKEISGHTIITFFRSIPLQLFKTGMFYCWLILLFLYIGSEAKRKWIIFGVSIGQVLLGYLFLYIWNADTYTWINTVILLPACVFAVNGLQNLSGIRVKEACIYAGVMSIVLYSIFSSSLNKTVRDGTELNQWTGELKTNKDAFYIVDINKVLSQYSVFAVYPKDIAQISNLCILNGIYKEIYGFENTTEMNKLENDCETFYIILSESSDVDRTVTNLSSDYIKKEMGYFRLQNAYNVTEYQTYMVQQ